MRKDGKLEKRLYELIVLIVARHAAAAYAWAVHDPLARKAGLSRRRGRAIQAQAQADVYEGGRDGRSMTRSPNFWKTNKISEATYQNLIKAVRRSTTRIEARRLRGLYCMIGAVINAFEVPTPNGEKPF